MIQKNYIRIFIAALAVLFMHSHFLTARSFVKNEPVERQLASFSTIRFDGGYDVELVKSNKEMVSIQTNKDKVEKVKTIVTNGRLHIYTDEPVPYYKVKITVYYVNIAEVRINGGVNLRSAEPLKGDSLNLKISGGGDIKLSIECTKLNLDFSGGANAEISGKTAYLNAFISGAGRLETSALEAENVKIELAGAAYANIFASKSLDALITGVGAINYSGNPARVKSQIIGIGSIKEK